METNWNSLSTAYNWKMDSEVMDILHLCSKSTMMMAKVMFPEDFTAEFSKLHEEIFALLDDDKIKRLVIAAPRGFGKTSIVMLAYAARRLLFRQRRFIVPISNSLTVAEMQSENLKIALTSNEYVRSFFGDIRDTPIENGEDTGTFSKKAWVANGYTIVLPRGQMQQVRGLKYRSSRPDEILIDDLEDTDTIGNEDIRKKRKNWFFGDLMNCISRYDDDWRFVYTDTLKHEDSLLQTLLDHPKWKGVRLSACTEDLKTSLAPEYMSDQQLQELVQEHQEAGTMHVFYREIMNMPVNPGDAMFQRKYYRYYNEEELLKKHGVYLDSFLLIDPSKTANPSSAETAIICVGISPADNAIYIRDIEHGRWHQDEANDRLFSMAQRYDVRTVGIEVTSLNEHITYPLKNEMLRRGFNFEIVELHAKGKKQDRPKGLVPLYRKGLIYHNDNGCCAVLEEQQALCPFNKWWDVIDAASYIPIMLATGDRFMYHNPITPSNIIPLRMGKPKNDEYADIYDIEDEYRTLKDAELPIAEWRAY